MTIALAGTPNSVTAIGSATTAAMNSTGADLLVLGLSIPSVAYASSDSKSNTWNDGDWYRYNADAIYARLTYALGSLTTGSGHTFTTASSLFYQGVIAAAFSGVGSFDQQSGKSDTASATSHPTAAGALTPAANGALLLSVLILTPGTDPGTVTPPTGFALLDAVDYSHVATNWQVYLAYEIQTTATARTPTWTTSNPINSAGVTNIFLPVAAAPVITGPTGAAGAASITHSVAELQNSAGTWTATDSVSWSLTGTDAADLSISVGGVVTKASGNFDFETKASYSFNVVNGSASQAVTLTITNVNEAPTITSNGGGPTASISIAENTTAVTTLTATDPDAGASLTWTISGGADADKFQITGGNLLSFITAPNFDAPGDVGGNNVYNVTVQASDGALTDTQDIAVTVTNVTELPGAPTIGTAVAGNASASVTFTPPATGTAPAPTSYTATSSPGGFTGTGAASPVTVSGLSNGTAYTFTVTATNSDGTGPASAASNSVTPAAGPSVNTHPTAQTAKIGATATFTASATASSAPLTAQWQKDGVNIAGATNTTTYARAGVALADHGAQFRCTYSDAAGGPVFTNAAPLTVAVTFINGPVPAQAGTVGSAASWDFSSYFAGGLSRTFSILLGALPAGMSQVGTTAVFSGTPTTAGSGTMVVSSADSAGNSDLTGTISWTIASAGSAPAITVQPASQSVTAGATASFSVTATGSALTYQWRRNGAPIAGATSSSYTTPTTTVSGGLANSGDLYDAVITGDTAPAVTSNTAELTVTAGAGATIISSALKNNMGWVHALAPFKAYLRDVATGTQLLTKTGLTTSQDGTIGFFDVSLAVGADYELRWDRTDTGERGWEIVRAI